MQNQFLVLQYNTDANEFLITLYNTLLSLFPSSSQKLFSPVSPSLLTPNIITFPSTALIPPSLAQYNSLAVVNPRHFPLPFSLDSKTKQNSKAGQGANLDGDAILVIKGADREEECVGGGE